MGLRGVWPHRSGTRGTWPGRFSDYIGTGLLPLSGAREGFFTADAVLRRNQSASFTADAVLRRNQSAGLTADALLRRGGSGSFTADAINRRTMVGSFTADAVIPGGNTFEGDFTADAVLRRGQTGSFTANAYIVIRQTGSFTANAVRLRKIFEDQFNRTVAAGLGGPWSWSPYDSFNTTSDDTIASVNGTEAVFDGSSDEYESWVGLPRTLTGDLYFDFYVPAVPGPLGGRPTYGVLLDATPDVYRGVYVGYRNSLGWDLFQFDEDTPFDLGVLDTSTWYRLHARWTTTQLFVNVWKRADPEPAGWLYDEPLESDIANALEAPHLDIYFARPEARVDNFEVWTSQSSWQGFGGFQVDAYIRAKTVTVDAVIRKVQTAALTANSVLRRASTASFTADAVIGENHPFTADAVIHRTQSASFTASAWIYRPRADPDGPGEPPGPGNPGDPGYQPGETPMVSIMVDGEDITRNCILSDATFTMLVNGGVGQFHVRVRDDAHERKFVTGSEITVDIDGRRKFGGYLIQPKRMLAFPVEDTTDPDRPSRFHVLEGVDYNFLLQKRVVRNKTDGKRVELRSWPAGSRSDVVTKYVFDNYTDLGADGVGYAGVLDIGSPNPDRQGVIGSGGLRFVDAMREINRLLGGVWYIDAYKELHLADVDTADAEVGLSDVPGVGQVGYRELEQIENGAQLANDALVWGAGQGSRRLKFARETDAPSIAAHKRWQYAEFRTDMFRQATVNERAESIVQGNDQSLRGAKDDQETWRLVTYERSFAAGQKVAVESQVFGKSDVVPIRRMTMTFPVKASPKFALDLSHEIDEPWNMFEFWFPKWPGFKPPPDIEIEPPNPPQGEEGCSDEVCGITDTFDRTVSANLTTAGPSDAGPVWAVTDWGFNDNSVAVVPGAMTTTVQDYVELTLPGMPLAAALGDAIGWAVTFEFRFDTSDVQTRLQVGISDGAYTFASLRIFRDIESPSTVNIAWNLPSLGNYYIPMQTGEWYHLRLIGLRIGDGFTVRASLWADGDVEVPDNIGSGFGGVTPPPEIQPTGQLVLETAVFDDLTGAVSIRNLDIEGMSACDGVQFDNFAREVASNGWGHATDGSAWTPSGSPSADSYGVTGGAGWIKEGVTRLAAPSDKVADDFVMRGRWRLDGQIPPQSSEIARSVSFGVTNGSGARSGCSFIISSSGGIGQTSVGEDADNDGALEAAESTTVSKTDWADDQWYDFEFERNNTLGLSRVRIWPTGTTRPDWQATYTGTRWTGGTPDRVYVSAPQVIGIQAASKTFWLDYLDIDYPGRPCYTDCGGDLTESLLVDNFNRSVGSGWGTASNGEAWGKTAVTGTTTESVDGAYGVSNHPGGSAVSVWRLDIPQTTEWLVNKSRMEARILLRGNLRNQLIGFYNESESEGVEVYLDGVGALSAAMDYGKWQNGARTLNTSSGSAHNVSDIPWWVALKLENNELSFKQWLASDPEPSTWEGPMTSVNLNVADIAVVRYQNGSQSGSGSFGIGHIELMIPDCVVTPTGPTVPGEPVAGSGRTSAVGNGSQTVFDLGAAYDINSTRVFVGGSFYRPGIEYTESDPDAGEITFTSPPALGADIEVFYQIAEVP